MRPTRLSSGGSRTRRRRRANCRTARRANGRAPAPRPSVGLGLEPARRPRRTALAVRIEMRHRARSHIADQRRFRARFADRRHITCGAARFQDTRRRLRFRQRTDACGRSEDRSRRKASGRAPWRGRCGFCRCVSVRRESTSTVNVFPSRATFPRYKSPKSNSAPALLRDLTIFSEKQQYKKTETQTAFLSH